MGCVVRNTNAKKLKRVFICVKKSPRIREENRLGCKECEAKKIHVITIRHRHSSKVGQTTDSPLDMQQQRDVMMVCLFDRNEVLMKSLILEAAPRVAAMGTASTRECVQKLLNRCNHSVEDCMVVFLTMLSRDTVMKDKAITGIKGQLLRGMSKEKARRFFLYLDRDVLLPWIRDEALSNASMIDKCREIYLVS